MVKKIGVSNDVFFTIDQLLESVKLFLFILIAPKILNEIDAAEIIRLNSGAFFLQLVVSSYLTQYLMVSYRSEPRGEWFFLFIRLVLPVVLLVIVISQNYILSIIFLSLIIGEYFKRVMYYSDSSIISFKINTFTLIVFLMTITIMPGLTALKYAMVYFVCSLIYIIMILSYDFKDSFSRAQSKVVFNKEFFYFGNKVVVSLVLYWVISQGVYFFSDYLRLTETEIINLKLTQTILGLSAIFAAIFETVILKKLGTSHGNDFFSAKKLSFYFLFSLLLCILNLLILKLFSSLYFNQIKISHLTLYLVLFQFVFIINRIPCAYLKKNLMVNFISLSYFIGFLVGFVFYLILVDSYEAILLVSFCMFVAHFIASIMLYFFSYFNYRDNLKCTII